MARGGDGRRPGRADPVATARILVAIFQGLQLQAAWDETVDVGAYAGAVETLLNGLLSRPGGDAAPR